MTAPETYDELALRLLAQEFAASDRGETDRKLRRHLREKKLGAFDEGRIALLRQLKDEVQAELHRHQDSTYYLGAHGPYAASEDFDLARLIADFTARFPALSPGAIAGFIPFAIYLYHLR